MRYKEGGNLTFAYSCGCSCERSGQGQKNKIRPRKIMIEDYAMA